MLPGRGCRCFGRCATTRWPVRAGRPLFPREQQHDIGQPAGIASETPQQAQQLNQRGCIDLLVLDSLGEVRASALQLLTGGECVVVGRCRHQREFVTVTNRDKKGCSHISTSTSGSDTIAASPRSPVSTSGTREGTLLGETGAFR